MKKSEIKIGTEYAQARGDWEFGGGRANRVRVVSLDGKVKQGWGYNAKTITGAIVDRLDKDGNVTGQTTVPNRQIREEWAPYHARHVAAVKAQRANAKAILEAKEERAKSLLEIIPLLRHAGLEDERDYVYNDEIRALYERHVPDCVEGTEGGNFYLVAPLAGGLDDYVRTGSAIKVKIADLKTLLGAR